jgi:hypothetical protein
LERREEIAAYRSILAAAAVIVAGMVQVAV